MRRTALTPRNTSAPAVARGHAGDYNCSDADGDLDYNGGGGDVLRAAAGAAGARGNERVVEHGPRVTRISPGPARVCADYTGRSDQLISPLESLVGQKGVLAGCNLLHRSMKKT